jgi:hypothetical protein
MYLKPILADKNFPVLNYDCEYKNTLADRHNNGNKYY